MSTSTTAKMFDIAQIGIIIIITIIIIIIIIIVIIIN